MKVPPHGDMLRWSAFIYALKCDFDNCLQYNQQAIDLALTHDIYHHVDAHLNSLYLNFAQAYITGDFDEVSDRIPVIEELLERYNDKQRRMLLLPYEGQYHLIKEQIEDADAIARHAYEASRVSSYDDGLRRSLTLQAEIALYQRDYTTARQCVTEAQEIMMGLAEFTESTWVQTLLHLIDEDYQSAAQELVLHLNGNSQRFMFPCLTAPARYTGKFGEAAYFGRAILHIVAVIQAGLGHHEQAAELMGKISVRPYPNQHWAEELPVFTNLPQQLQSVLGHETYLEAFERGRSLNLLEIMPPILKSYAE